MKTYPIKQVVLAKEQSGHYRKELIRLTMTGLIIGHRIERYYDEVLESVRDFNLFSEALRAFKQL